jgi:hypothetical protein
MAWLGIIARNDYEGALPGIQDSYIDFAKNENGTYTGSIAIGEGIFPFHDATVFHLAASISLALGSEQLSDDSSFKDMDLVKLGKSIDLMAKAKYITTLDDLMKGAPGPPHAPVVTGVPEAPVPGTKQKEKGPKPPKGQQPKKAPTEAKIPKPKIPKAKVQLPKPKIPGRKSIAVPDAAMKSECGECGLPLIKNERFVGCMCFKDMARYVTLEKSQGKRVITFGSSVDDEGIAAILDTLGVNRHG